MSITNILQLTQLRAEVAKIRAMATWPPGPTVYGDKCPFCSSTDYGKYSVENGTQRYRCRACGRRFNQRRAFTCHCQEPGQGASRCHGCPKFEEFLEAFKQHTMDLSTLSLSELETLQNAECSVNSDKPPED
jgi:hypothetical protein